MNKRLTARNLIFWVFISTQSYHMVSEVKDLDGKDLLKQFECGHHAFTTRYLGWKEMPETKDGSRAEKHMLSSAGQTFSNYYGLITYRSDLRIFQPVHYNSVIKVVKMEFEYLFTFVRKISAIFEVRHYHVLGTWKPLLCMKSKFECIRFLKPVVQGETSNFVEVSYLMFFTKYTHHFMIT